MKAAPAGQSARIPGEPWLLAALALTVSLGLFGVFVGLAGSNPLEVYHQMYRGAFGSWFSFQNTLQRAAPLMLTALCTALPARLGLVIIGGEGALVLGGLAAAVTAHAVANAPPCVVLGSMMFMGALAGGLWVALAGALRALRGVNETIGSLLLGYVAIAVFNHLVEGPLRDPASLNKPSTFPIGAANALGNIPGMDVDWGLVIGISACLFCYVLMDRSLFGFAARIVGGNVKAGLLCGLPVSRLVITTCFLGGAFAGLSGMVEVAAVHGTANASLMAGYGYTGILVAFLARQSPLAVIPVSILLGGINASGGLLQRTQHLPDATVNVLQGILFLVVLASETLGGRLPRFPARARATTPQAAEA